LIISVCAGAGVVLGITATAIWAGIWGLGTSRDRAAAVPPTSARPSPPRHPVKRHRVPPN